LSIDDSLKEIVIPKEHAGFWLDRHGAWHCRDGRFQHRKIIETFHSCIRKDEGGFHLTQRNGDFKESVYP
jgi:hypothetical protein